jgi:hypothetical protein
MSILGEINSLPIFSRIIALQSSRLSEDLHVNMSNQIVLVSGVHAGLTESLN